ncbi:Mur ligase family protein [Acidovorax radicis]|jgi:UDP-N-acetylmuramoylalanine--D-glutamate ligase|uniref:Mur ligase family protein n=1 Tax=Acidovorax radicis TaxID=758826 RepID=UPI001CFA4736|nr:UDP-N-acetylmuramoyl-L-alanine--D-glutamate ligase [Acidovorax radicis]UCU99943.1 UDP-N-acetylmuramoyl-L-alanine--D-glutamate ligase [Acidovorax radicis]
MNPNDPLHPAHPGAPDTMPAEAGIGAAAPGAPEGSPEADGGRVPQAQKNPAAEGGDGVVAHTADVAAATLAGDDGLLAGPDESTVSPPPEPAADGDLTQAPASKAAGAGHAWDPEAVPAVSAAKAAADFVAQIFADVATPDAAPAALALTEDDVAATPDAAVTESAAPAVRPGDSLRALLQGRHILILGLGASGLAMARWCARCGAQVTVADTRVAPPQLAVLQQEMPDVRFVPGAFDATLVQGQNLDAVYRSPGLSPATVAPVFVAASDGGISVGGELSLYSAALAALHASHGYAPAVLAITGTNGKTTVTSLTGQLVERAGRRVAVAGNIGPTLLDTLASHLDADTLPDVWVLELSSFQLDGVTGFEPTAATVLNITQDHLDWHGDIDAYAAAKARIFGQTGLMILNREDAAVMGMLPPPGRPKAAAAPLGGSAAHAVASVGAPQPVPPPVKVKLQKPQVRTHLTFGGDMPRRPGDFGIEVVSGMPWLVRAMDADETRKRGRNEAEEDLHIQRLMPADALRIRGRHNAVNALAALALASAAGCPLASMLYGLREYRGEPHRVEPVAVVNGVEFFDDSKGTNVGATVAALTGLGAERRLVVILGGDGKGQDFAPLAAPVARHARAVVLIGRDAPLIRAALQETGVALLNAETLPEAVGLAAQRAHVGDAVLMSPACASFDMFTGYEHRAQVFCDTVRALADDAGQSAEGLA